MHEYFSSQHCVVTNIPSWSFFFVNYAGKDSSGTIYEAFQDPWQIPKIPDCPGHSGTVGAFDYCCIYVRRARVLLICASSRTRFLPSSPDSFRFPCANHIDCVLALGRKRNELDLLRFPLLAGVPAIWSCVGNLERTASHCINVCLP